jgi:hypothetical protein
MCICIYSIPGLIKRKQTKEIAVFLGLILAAFCAGYIYISDPLVHKSIEGIIMKAIGTEF